MNRSYSFELAIEYPEAIANILLPVRVRVTYRDQLRCYSIINEDGLLDVVLPEADYEKIQNGQARLEFPRQQHSPDEPDQLMGIEIVDAA